MKISPNESPGESSLQGDLEVIPLEDLVQLLGYSGHRVRVEVTVDDEPRGQLWFDAGRLAGCSSGSLRGSEAFLDLLEVRQGSFRVLREGELPFDRQQAIPWQGLLLESTVRRDLENLESPDAEIEALFTTDAPAIDPEKLAASEVDPATISGLQLPSDESDPSAPWNPAPQASEVGFSDPITSALIEASRRADESTQEADEEDPNRRIDGATLGTRVSRFESDYRHARPLLTRPTPPAADEDKAIHPLVEGERFSPESPSRERDRRP
ncbi:MAG: DUF4388 domain-containing protein [Acidobacteriota bacterium]